MISSAQARVAVLIAIFMIVFSANPAAAHTGFESSSPAEGARVDAPVTEITLTFSGEAMPAGTGFIVLDPAGRLREPDRLTSEDNLTWAQSRIVPPHWGTRTPSSSRC